jgi:class 3 adenylate cyclase
VPLPKYSLQLLGRFELSGPDGPIELANKKLAALLAYLACSAPEPQSREKLATLLWGSHFEAQARQNLRQALSRLRRALGHDVLISDGDEISLAHGVIDCDVARLKALSSEGNRASLAAAADLYQDPLLADVNIAEEAWADWLGAERPRLEGLALDAMIRYAGHALQSGNAESALNAANRAISVNGLREDAHRLIVQALAATGRKAEALKHYQDLVALLKRELNTEPDAATKSLAAELRSTPPLGRSPTVSEIAKPVPQAAAARDDEPSSAATVRSGSSERRQLTIMACNMVGSTLLAARLDPEDMRDVIASFHKGVADVVSHFDGFVAQYQGDGVLVYFGYPAAHEHDTEQAVRAGLAILDAVRRLKVNSDVSLQARVGIATGLVVVGEQPGAGDTRQRVAIGETPDLAARLQAAAAPGEVVVAASTRRLVGRMFDCRPLGAVEVTGLRQAVEAWQVRGETAGVSRFEARRVGALSPLVGRQEEMALLLRRWDQAKLGEGRVVLLSGEPGIGKSRIAESLLVGLEGEPHVRLRYFCSPHHANSPLYPFIAQLERAASFEPGSSTSAKLDKLEALLKPTSGNMPRDVALIAELLAVPADGRYPALSVSPQQKREMTLTALLDQLKGAAAQGPVLIVCEDVHWLDPTSQDLLDRTVARIVNLPVLLVVTVRPEVEPSWVGQPHVSMLPLSRLGRRDSAGIIDGVAKGKALPDAVVEQVLAHTDGVPLFIEELTSTLLENGLLRETPDRYVLDGPLPPRAIPTTLQASLVARLDRLGSVKDVAPIGAAIGREFSHELIAAVSALAPTDLDAALERLTASGLISRRGTPPDATYSFKHALVQDTAYESLLKSQRTTLHGKIALALEKRWPESRDTKPELLANHYTAAGLFEAAIPYWRRAGELAMQRFALREAITHLNNGMLLIEKLPPGPQRDLMELELRTVLGPAVVAQHGWAQGEVSRILEPAWSLTESLDHRPSYVPVLHSLWVHYLSVDRLALSLKSAEKLLAAGAATRDDSLEAVGYRAASGSHYWLGDLTAARREGDALRAMYDPRRHWHIAQLTNTDPLTGDGIYRGQYLWMLGYPDQARVASDEKDEHARRRNHPFDLAFALTLGAQVFDYLGEPEELLRRTEEAERVCRVHGVALLGEILAEISRGVVSLRAGRAADSVVQLEKAIGRLEATGHRVWVRYLRGLQGQGLALTGDLEGASALIEESVLATENGEARVHYAELLRLRGWVLMLLGRPQEAEATLRASIDVARAQKAKSWELRSTTTLARLLAERQDRAPAREMLSDVYDWFTEGFCTKDLKEAKAVLDTL